MDNLSDNSDNSSNRQSTRSDSMGQTGHRRPTVEDVEDDDDIMSSSSGRDSRQSKTRKHHHPQLNGMLSVTPIGVYILTVHFLGKICNKDGVFLPANTPPSARHDPEPTDWGSYESRTHFELAEFLYKDAQMSAGNIDKLFKIWGNHAASTTGEAPFTNHKELYAAIDATTVGEVPWQSFKLRYCDSLPEQGEIPDWMLDEHEVWFRDPRQLLRNLLANTDFDGEFDYAPFQEYDEKGKHRYQDFMSGNWAWRQAVRA